MANYKPRKAIFSAIQNARSSTVVPYITGDRQQMETPISPELIHLFVEHLDAIGPTRKLSLILHTNDGDTGAAWRLINVLHTFCDELEPVTSWQERTCLFPMSFGCPSS